MTFCGLKSQSKSDTRVWTSVSPVRRSEAAGLSGKISRTPVRRCGSTASSCILKTSSSTTPPATSAPPPTNSPSPATSYAPAGASPRRRRIGHCLPRVSEICDKRRTSNRSAPRRWRRPLSFDPQPSLIRKGTARMDMAPKIFLASTMPSSTQCWPDRRPRSRAQNDPAVVAFKTKTR